MQRWAKGYEDIFGVIFRGFYFGRPALSVIATLQKQNFDNRVNQTNMCRCFTNSLFAMVVLIALMSFYSYFSKLSLAIPSLLF